jgi:leucyl aminopeptidase
MDKLNKVISTTKKLINLPYNLFNLENYYSVLLNNKIPAFTVETQPNQPIKLMSGGNFYSRIITSSNLHNRLKKGRKIYIIGKGILFDSGGYNLKTGRTGPYGMHDDKAGMIIALNVANYLKENIIAYCPVTTNFIHNSKIIPGDIIKIGKKDVKVTNTDAEGRLILAEALANLNPGKDDIVITIATLTGAVGYAIGEEATGVFSDNNELLKKYAGASFEAKELAWALPLWQHYQERFYDKKLIHNSIDEIKCGATEGALFIKQFVKYPNRWIHLDIASSSFDKQGHANGVPIRSLVNFIKKLNE